MLIFINSNGEVVGTTPLGITQGSSKANTLQLVCPFPNAIVSVSFQLPNGIVLGPYLEDDYGAPANEYVMQKAFTIPGYGVEGSELTVYTYTCNKEISALPGKLGVQFFVHVGEVVKVEEKKANEYGGYTLAVELIQIPIYNGTKFIPNPAFSSNIPEVDTWDEVLELLSGLRTDVSDLSSNAVLKNPVLPNQTIRSNIILAAGNALRADEVAATNLSTGKAEIINRGDLVFSDIGTEFNVSPILDGDVIVGLRIPGKVEASHIKSTIGDIGSIYTELGIDIDANYGDISFNGDGGVGGDSKPVSYRIRANIKHDDEWDQDYVAGLAFYGEDDVFYGNVSFTKKVTLSEAIVEKTVRFFGGILGNDTQSGKIALKFDPGFGIRFDGEHDPENGYDDNGVSIVPDDDYDPETDRTRVKGLIITNGKHKIYGEVAFSDVGVTFERDRATFNNPIYAYDTIHGQSAEFTDAYIDGTLEISGDLVVNGQTTTVQHETLVVKDNIIVTNSDGLQFSTSGLLINKGNGKAYGILYQPAEDLVYIGEGTYYGDKSNPTFDFDEGEALPLAARSGSFSNNQIPVWDSAKNAFKSSGKITSDFLNRVSNPDAVTLLYTEKQKNTGQGTITTKCGYASTEAYSTVPYRNAANATAHPGTFEISHPELDTSKTQYSAKHPMTVGVAEDRYVHQNIYSSGRAAYVNSAGTDTLVPIINDYSDGSTYNVYSLACRNKAGGITVSDPISPLDAVNKRTMEAALANAGGGSGGGWNWDIPSHNFEWLQSVENKPSEIFCNLYINDLDYTLGWSGAGLRLLYDSNRNSYVGSCSLMVVDAGPETVVEKIFGSIEILFNSQNIIMTGFGNEERIENYFEFDSYDISLDIKAYKE